MERDVLSERQLRLLDASDCVLGRLRAKPGPVSDVLVMAGGEARRSQLLWNGKSTAKGATRLEMSVSCITIAYSHAARISYVKQGERVLAKSARPGCTVLS